jgi:hypothetical protein
VPPDRPGPGCRIVTGTFAHGSGQILDVAVEGLAEPIGTTASHPFWSEDRRAFVPAGELAVGETLRTAAGQRAAVTRITPRPTTEPVYVALARVPLAPPVFLWHFFLFIRDATRRRHTFSGTTNGSR